MDMRLNGILLYCVVCALLQYVSSAEFGQFDNVFDQDDADKAKWIASANCVHGYDASGVTDGSVIFAVDAYENDASFSEFESCEMLVYNDLVTSNTVTKAGCSVTRESATTTDPEYKHFRYSETNIAATTAEAAGADANSACGGYKDGMTLYLAMYCYRDDLTLKQGDAIFLAQCNADTQYAVMTTLTYGELTIGGPAMEQIIRRNELTFDVLDGSAIPDYDSDAVKTTFNLGDAVRMRICLKIDTAAGDTRTEFAEGTDPMGFVVGECVATRHVDHTDDATDSDRIPDAGTPLSTSKGCGLGAPPAQQAGAQDWFMFWVKSASDAADAYKKSPNCWYSESFEAVSFLGKNVKNVGTPSERKATITCTLEHFCLSSTDTQCFGDKSGAIKTDGSGYPTCPAGYTRRKRDVFRFNEDDMPEAVNTTITVRNTGRASSNDSSSTVDCFTKKSTFFVVVGVLLFLLLFSTTVVALLLYRFTRRGRRDGSEHSKTRFAKTLDIGSHNPQRLY